MAPARSGRGEEEEVGYTGCNMYNRGGCRLEGHRENPGIGLHLVAQLHLHPRTREKGPAAPQLGAQPACGVGVRWRREGESITPAPPRGGGDCVPRTAVGETRQVVCEERTRVLCRLGCNGQEKRQACTVTGHATCRRLLEGRQGTAQYLKHELTLRRRRTPAPGMRHP